MSNSSSLTEAYESLPKLAKIILQIFFGAFIGGIYRIIRYVETRNIVTLVVGILVLVTFIGNIIAWIVDLVTEITVGRITVLAD
ncbi:MAG: hypothetical protein DBY04_03100 [Clostridiales bacterium]|nr:MAG: hypothetical protein DBY04_03100 [Clostridiales bacterium]